MGIALSHFHQTALEKGQVGQFGKMENTGINMPENTTYIISWEMEKNI